MCIISFYRNEDEFVLTHNRDEEINRSSSKEIVEQKRFGGLKNFKAQRFFSKSEPEGKLHGKNAFADSCRARNHPRLTLAQKVFIDNNVVK